MAESTNVLAAVSIPQEKKKKGFLGIKGLLEGRRKNREAAQIQSELLAVIERGVDKEIKEVLSDYCALDEKQKARIIAALTERLKYLERYPYEYEEKPPEISIVASTLLCIAQQDPKGVDPSRLKDAKGSLAHIVGDGALFDSANPYHAIAHMSCVAALWEMGYGDYDFWESRLLNDMTKHFTASKLLNMEDAGLPRERGWEMLAKNLPKVGEAILGTASAKKSEFLAYALKAEDKDTLENAIIFSKHFEALPEEFYDAILRLSLMGDSERLWATDKLTDRYDGENDTARKLLQRLGKEITSCLLEELEANEGKVNQISFSNFVALANLSMLGFYPYDAEELKKLMEPFITSPPAHQAFFAITTSIFANPLAEHLKPVAAEMESDRVNIVYNALDSADDRQYAASIELISLYGSGRAYLAEAMIEIGNNMVEIIRDPPGEDDREKAISQHKAKSIIEALGQVGIEGNFTITEAPLAMEGMEIEGKITPSEAGSDE